MTAVKAYPKTHSLEKASAAKAMLKKSAQLIQFLLMSKTLTSKNTWPLSMKVLAGPMLPRGTKQGTPEMVATTLSDRKTTDIRQSIRLRG